MNQQIIRKGGLASNLWLQQAVLLIVVLGLVALAAIAGAAAGWLSRDVYGRAIGDPQRTWANVQRTQYRAQV